MNPLVIPSTSSRTGRFLRANWIAATAMIGLTASFAYGQGSETFTNLPTTSSSSYLSRSWTGDNAVTWTAEGARTDRTINGKAICFGTSGNRWVKSPVYAGGMGTLSFNYVRDFTSASARSLEVYINGNKIGGTITVSTSSDVAVAYSETINISGNVELEIRSTGAAQVKVDDMTWTVGAPDTTDPVIVSRTPADNAVDVPAAATTALVVVFNEAIVKGTGDITVNGGPSVMTIPVTDAAVVVSGSTATITLPSSLAASTAYYINITDGAFKDAANNTFNGITDTSTWNFTTAAADETPPSIITRSPADDSNTAFPTANLVATYDESLVVVGGSVLIKTSIGGTLVDTIPVPSSQVQVSGATVTLNPAVVLAYGTGYYVEITAGTFKDAANNLSTAVSGNSAWNFTTRPAPDIVISQYYEGASNNKYIELKNLTAGDIELSDYRLAVWSNADREAWKSGAGNTLSVSSLSGTIPANGSFLVASVSAAAPAYAANNFDQSVPSTESAIAFNGDDSVVLYNGAGFTQNEVEDAVSFVANDGQDKSFYRLTNGPGFDLATGSSILDDSGVWGTKTYAQVDSALISEDWYLSASSPPKELTLSIHPTSFFESAGATAATATVTRSGDPTDALVVIIESSNSNVAAAGLSVEIPAEESSAEFSIEAFDNPWLNGNQNLTFTVSADFHTPASQQVTVQDDPNDAPFPVVINEVDAAQPGTDGVEFIELYNTSNQPISLVGVVLVFYNGDLVGDASYKTIDLSEYSIPANDYFVIGSSLVANVDLTAFTTNGIQNGPDAIALYLGDPNDYPNGILPTAAPGVLLDAIVYSDTLTQDAALIAALTPGNPQVDENLGANGDLNAMARIPDGGAAFDTTLYVAQAPTPGTSNVPSTGDTFADWIGSLDFSGFTSPDLTPTGDPDNDGLANSLENILGTSPAAASQGLTAVSASGGNLIFRHTRSATAASDLAGSYEWSANLANWHASGASAGDTTVTFGTPAVITPGTPDLVQVTATVTGTTPATKVFARFKVVRN